MANNVNIDRLSRREVERRFADKFRELILQVTSPENVTLDYEEKYEDVHVDIVARLNSPLGPKLTFLIECKTQPRPGLVPDAPGERSPRMPAVAINQRFDAKHRLKEASVWVFAAPFVSKRLGEVCSERGWSWFDLAGNCAIRVPGLLHIQREGNLPVHKRSRPDANLGTPGAAQVIRALLKPENNAVHWTSQQSLRDLIYPGVSVGLTHKIVAYLRDEGHLAAQGHAGFKVVDKVKLLESWRDAYVFDRVHKVEWFTLLKTSEIQEAMNRMNLANETRIVWSAFSAAERQAPMVIQSRYWLMASDDRIDWAVDELKAKPVPSGANLVLMTAPDLGYLDRTNDIGIAGPCTHLLQTYVDTYHAGGRGPEAAEAILEQKLRPAWGKGIPT
jgi:hypothetical protein